MANQRVRRKWALELAAALLLSDMDTVDLDEFDDEEQLKRQEAVRKIAAELQKKAAKIIA